MSNNCYKEEVLEEDTYMNQMGDIIERDFFPDLIRNKISNHNEFRSNELIIPAVTPDTFETPKPGELAIVPEEPVESVFKKPKLSLNQFCSLKKNQETENFKETLAKDEEKRREGKAWMYEVPTVDVEKRLKVPSIEEQANIKNRPLEVDSWDNTIHNSLMFNPDGVDQKDDFVSGNEQIIKYENTRFKTDPFDKEQCKDMIQMAVMKRNLSLAGKIGVDGKVIGSTESEDENLPLTPSCIPGMYVPPMTWGTIDSTPVRIEDREREREFTMQPVPKREKIAMRLGKATSSNAKPATPSFLSRGIRNLKSPRSLLHSSPHTPKGRIIRNLLRGVQRPRTYRSPTTTTSGGIRTVTSTATLSRPRSERLSFGSYRSPRFVGMAFIRRPSSSQGSAGPPDESEELEEGDVTDNLLQLPNSTRPSE